MPAAPVSDIPTSYTAEIADSLDVVSQAIQKCADRIRKDPRDLQTALDLITQTTDNPGSKVVITGVGKSFLIGKKLAATLTSVGTTTVSLHATEALHGDLGIVRPGDCIIALSYSGNTDEVLNLVRVLKSTEQRCMAERLCIEGTRMDLSLPIIGMGRSKDSPLGSLCDAWIECGVDSELSTLVNAPTCSSSLMLAIGDSVAIMLMNRRQFGPIDFARNHPGGNLGKLARSSDILKLSLNTSTL